MASIFDIIDEDGVASRAARISSKDETDEQQFTRQISEQIEIVKKCIADKTSAPLTRLADGSFKEGWTRAHWVSENAKTNQMYIHIGFPPMDLNGKGVKALKVANLKQALERLEMCRDQLVKDRRFMNEWGQLRADRIKALEAARAKTALDRTSKNLKRAA